MKNVRIIAAAILVIVFFASCNRNYYSGSGKGGKNCGCPSHKGMSGY